MDTADTMVKVRKSDNQYLSRKIVFENLLHLCLRMLFCAADWTAATGLYMKSSLKLPINRFLSIPEPLLTLTNISSHTLINNTFYSSKNAQSSIKVPELAVLFRESMWIKIRFDRIVEDVALRRLSYFTFMGSEYSAQEL